MTTTQTKPLIDLVDILFSNLDEIQEDSYIDELLQEMKYSSISYLEPIFIEIKKFKLLNNRYPDTNYLKIIGGDLIRCNDNVIFSSDVLTRILNIMKEESKIARAIEALMKGKEDSALSILQSAKTTEVKAPTLVSNAYDIYKTMKLRPPGLKFYIPDLDAIFRSVTRSSVTTIIAPPKNGKTTTGISMFYENIMQQDMNSVYIILEGSSNEIVFNLISLHSKRMGKPISAFRIKTGELSPDEEEFIKEVQEDFDRKRKGGYAILEPSHFSAMTPNEISRTIKSIKAAWGGKLDAVYSDYIQLYKHYRIPGISDEKSVINYWIRFWHDLSLVEDFAKIILSQMNREGEATMIAKNIVTARAFAEANEIERSSARVIALMSNPMMQQNNTMKIFCVYHRYGPLPSDPLEVYADFAHFQVGEEAFSSIRTIGNIEQMLDGGIDPFS